MGMIIVDLNFMSFKTGYKKIFLFSWLVSSSSSMGLQSFDKHKNTLKTLKSRATTSTCHHKQSHQI